MIHLYPDQSTLVDKIRAAIISGHKAICIQYPTGGGKTIVFSFISKSGIDLGGKILTLTDRAELLTETGGTLAQFGINYFGIKAGQMVPPPDYFRCYVAMSQTLRRRINDPRWTKWFKQFTIVIIDECFIAGTKIGNINIEDIQVGDIVDSFNHETGQIEKKEVLSVFKNKRQNDLIKINLSCVSIVCTKKHPIFVLDKGYINAEKIKENDRVILHNMQQKNGEKRLCFKQLVRQEKKVQKKWILFLLNKMSKYILRSSTFKKDDPIKPNGKTRNESEDVCNFKEDWSQADSSGWEWERVNNMSRITVEPINIKNHNRLVSRTNNNLRGKIFEWGKVVQSLQNRYWMYKSKNSNRDRWGFSFFINSKKKRLKKNTAIRVERVQSVEVYKQRNKFRFAKSSKFDYVYNLEVKDNNNYFANGILVHNCHKQEFNPYFETPDLFNGAQILGFSATPSRTGKQRQLAIDYSYMVEGLQVQELINLNRLLPAKHYGISSIQKTKFKLNTHGDDFDESDMFTAFNRPEVYAGAIKAYKEHANNTVNLVFCCNISHVIETCREYNEAGIPAKFLVSDVPKPTYPEKPTLGNISRYELHLEKYNKWRESFALWSGDRDKVLKEWKSGQFKVLINAGILTTGFNAPFIETIQVLRATISIPLWLQMVGRGSRLFPGKTHFNILDHGTNIQRIGRYNDNRKWSLIHETSKGGGAAPVKECGKDQKPDKAGRRGCGCYLQTSVMLCPYCGFQYQTEKERIEAALVLMNEPIMLTNAPVKKVFEFEEFERTAAARGYKEGWTIRQIALKYGFEGLQRYGKSKGRSNGWAYMIQKTMKI